MWAARPLSKTHTLVLFGVVVGSERDHTASSRVCVRARQAAFIIVFLLVMLAFSMAFHIGFGLHLYHYRGLGTTVREVGFEHTLWLL